MPLQFSLVFVETKAPPACIRFCFSRGSKQHFSLQDLLQKHNRHSVAVGLFKQQSVVRFSGLGFGLDGTFEGALEEQKGAFSQY